MEILTVTRKEGFNAVVESLNARVYTSTFKDKTGVQLGDLYTYKGTQCINPDEIVAHGTCSPCMGKFVKTVILKF